MPLTEDTARTIVHALENAANIAKQSAKTEEANASMALAHPPFPMPPNDNLAAYNARQHARSDAAKKAQLSIAANANILVGLVLLASSQHTKGVGLLDAGTDTSYLDLGHPDPRETEVYLAHEAFMNQDLPALDLHHRVKPGIFDRL